MSSDRRQLARAVAAEARALPADEREAFLRSRCGDDAGLLEETQVGGVVDHAAHVGVDVLNPDAMPEGWAHSAASAAWSLRRTRA